MVREGFFKEVGSLFFLIIKKIYIYLICLLVWLCQVLVAARGIQSPDQGSNLGSLHWELRVLATGPPRKSLNSLLSKLCVFESVMLHPGCLTPRFPHVYTDTQYESSLVLVLVQSLLK